MKRVFVIAVLLVLFSEIKAQSVTKVTVTTTSSLILTSNTGRAGFMIYNSSDTILIKFGSTISDTSVYTFPLCHGMVFKCTSSDCNYKGKIYAVTKFGTKTLLITDF